MVFTHTSRNDAPWSLAATETVVAAYVSKNPVSTADLPGLIASVYKALSGLGAPDAPPAAVQEPAVPVKKSVTPDFIICLDDGKKFKSLRRHITMLGYTPESYRAKWGLPADYPLVCASYSAKRSALAKEHGLGRKA